MTWTAMALLVCLAHHPDRCAVYSLVTDAPEDACDVAAGQFVADRPYLVAVAQACREETGS